MPRRSAKQSKVTEQTQAPESAPADDPQDCPEDDARRQAVAMSAYYRAEARGFAPGGEEEDWLAAEREVEAAGSNPA